MLLVVIYISNNFPSTLTSEANNIFPFHICCAMHDVSWRGIHLNSLCPLRTGSNCAMSFISARELWCVSGLAPKGRCFTVNELQSLTSGGCSSPSCLFCDYSPLRNFRTDIQILYNIHTRLSESKGTVVISSTQLTADRPESRCLSWVSVSLANSARSISEVRM